MPDHGEVKGHRRWCRTCDQWHGVGYVCEFYPDDLRNDLEQKLLKTQQIVSTKEWADRQLADGTPPEVIAITRMFCGVD